MKKILIYLPLLLLIAACGKRGKFEQIEGVNLFDGNNVPMGMLGAPDVLTDDANLQWHTYPVPTTNGIQYLSIENKSSAKKTYTLEVVAAHFRKAPKKYSFPRRSFDEPEEYRVKVENLNGKPKDVLLVHNFEIAANESKDIAFELSNLKQGFYRATITSNEGERYWSNLWIFRPE